VYQKDWLLRQIEMLAAMIARLLELRRAGDDQEIQRLIDEAYRDLFGLDPRLIGLLPDAFLIHTLMSGDRIDGHRALVLACLLREDAAGLAARGDVDEAERRLIRSLQAFLAASKDDVLPPEHADLYDVRQVMELLGDAVVAPAIRYDLFHYYEDSDRYAQAEDVLFDLIGESASPEALIAEGIDFYRWLLTLDDQALEAGGLPRAEVQESLERLLAP